MLLHTAVAGLIGGILAFNLSYIDPTSVFNIQYTEFPIVMVLFGGLGTVLGPVIGGFIFVILYEILWSTFPQAYQFLFGIARIIGIVLFMPEGIIEYLKENDRIPVGGRSEMATPEYILEVENVEKRFGELVAVNDVSFGIERGAFVGLIGPNGAGKSTLFNLITGVLSPTSGAVFFNGEDITDNALRKNAERGLVRTFQQTRVLERMTVRENLLIASQLTDSPESRADELLETIELVDKQNNLARDLSFGQQKLVSISQVLMLEPELILLDEPLAGVNPTMENKILEIMRSQVEEGKTFVLVEHDMDVVMSECEDVIVMESGSILTRGPPSEVQQDERVLEAYFGSDDDE